MAEEAKVTPAEEAQATTEPATPKAAEEAKPEAKPKEETVGDLLNTAPKKEEPRMVPESALIKMKREKQAAVKELEKFKESIEEGASPKEIKADLKALANKYPDVDPDFLQDFATAVHQQMEEDVEGKMTAKLKPIEEKDRAEKIDKAFNTHYAKSLEKMPEYEGVVNKEVIKALSLSQSNSDKTLTQIIEESYGHLVQGKRGIDSASTRAGKNDSLEVDTDKARKDPAYFKEIMANPVLKKKYNDSMMGRLTSQL